MTGCVATGPAQQKVHLDTSKSELLYNIIFHICFFLRTGEEHVSFPSSFGVVLLLMLIRYFRDQPAGRHCPKSHCPTSSWWDYMLGFTKWWSLILQENKPTHQKKVDGFFGENKPVKHGDSDFFGEVGEVANFLPENDATGEKWFTYCLEMVIWCSNMVVQIEKTKYSKINSLKISCCQLVYLHSSCLNIVSFFISFNKTQWNKLHTHNPHPQPLVLIGLVQGKSFRSTLKSWHDLHPNKWCAGGIFTNIPPNLKLSKWLQQKKLRKVEMGEGEHFMNVQVYVALTSRHSEWSPCIANF